LNQPASIKLNYLSSNLNAAIVTERESLMAYLNGLLPSSIHLQAGDVTKPAVYYLIGYIESKYFYILADHEGLII
jgi:hypothetical protein